MTGFKELTERYEEFVDERDWNQFHTPKNLAEAISVEANELLELFLWHGNHSSEKVCADDELKGRVKEELADVVIYSIAMANQLDIDLTEAIKAKMADNEERFDQNTTAEITEDLSRWQKD